MAKPELGTKRLCGSCGAKFYDLSKDPIVCPKCSTVFQVIVPVTRARPGDAGRAAAAAAAGVAAAAAAAAAKAKEAEVAEQEEGAEFVSLEDADAEAQGKKTEGGDVPDTDDIEVEEDESMDDAAFIQEEEEGDADVTDIIGDGITKEEET